jgi:hypothetical protein
MFIVSLLNDAQKFQKIWQVLKLIKQNRKAFIISNILLQELSAIIRRHVFCYICMQMIRANVASVFSVFRHKMRKKMQAWERDDSDILID